jgi:hypothetical protein
VGPPPEPSGVGFRVQACAIDRSSDIGKTMFTYGVFSRTIVLSGLGHMKWCFGP